MDTRDLDLGIPYSLKVVDGFLAYSLRKRRFVEAKPVLLDHFLAIKTDADVLTFATRWGVMRFCEHHLMPWCDKPNCPPIRLATEGRFSAADPLDAWHDLVEKARSRSRLAESIRSGGKGSREDWKRVDANNPEQPWKSSAIARTEFAQIMNDWLRVGGVTKTMSWQQEGWVLSSKARGLFGNIALYLTRSQLAGFQSATCTYCKQEYWPERQPSPGQKNHCKKRDCGRSYWRDNKRAQRLKVRTGRGNND